MKRRTIEELLSCRIPSQQHPKNGVCTWKELMETPGIEPSDVVTGVFWDDNNHKFEEYPVVEIIRERLETEEEAKERIAAEKRVEDKEFERYLQLKVKFASRE